MRYLSFFIIILFVFNLSTAQAESTVEPPKPVKVSKAKTSTHQWAMDRMVHFAPPGRKMGYPDAQETEKEARERYWDIIDDAITVAYDPNEPPISSNKHGRAMTLSIILGLAGHESGYRKDVDFNIGKYSRGDNGRSWCMNQVWMGHPTKDGSTDHEIILEGDGWRYAKKGESGYSGQDLIEDRQICFRVSLHIARHSWKTCSRYPVLQRLAIYTSGQDCKTGLQASANRVQTAIDWMARGKPDLDDEHMMKILHPHLFKKKQDPPNSEKAAIWFDRVEIYDVTNRFAMLTYRHYNMSDRDRPVAFLF